jgi:hypothetical protein
MSYVPATSAPYRDLTAQSTSTLETCLLEMSGLNLKMDTDQQLTFFSYFFTLSTWMPRSIKNGAMITSFCIISKLLVTRLSKQRCHYPDVNSGRDGLWKLALSIWCVQLSREPPHTHARTHTKQMMKASTFWKPQSCIINNVYSYTSSWTFTLKGELHKKCKMAAEHNGHSGVTVIEGGNLNLQLVGRKIFQKPATCKARRWVLQRQIVMVGAGQDRTQ